MRTYLYELRHTHALSLSKSTLLSLSHTTHRRCILSLCPLLLQTDEIFPAVKDSSTGPLSPFLFESLKFQSPS
ncbi:hypothetical protein L1887_30427 [Cichorium endivia]|nr:hypothetical protein L1887_30427 [Cichorium endivia]